jgi:hypothetical protein
VGPVHRSILAVDIESSTTRTDLIKFELRRQIYNLLDQAMAAAGVEKHYREPLVDRGDGILALIHPADEVPKSRLLNPFIPELTRLLAVYNAKLTPAEAVDWQLRLRTVIHAGEILCDDYGSFGTELDVAFRLLDAQAVKACLRHTLNPLVLVISEHIYESIVMHRYEGICPETYSRSVRVNVAGRRRYGWVHVPAASTPCVPPWAA